MAKKKVTNSRSLDYILIEFSDHPDDVWTNRNAFEGVQICGGIGSGKSSGSGKTIATSLLKAGYGGIVLTSKVDETIRWLEYAQNTNRLHDVVIFGERSSLKKYKKQYPILNTQSSYFNPMTYESTRPKEDGGGQTSNIVHLFSTIIKMGNRATGTAGGGSKDPFWDLALNRCMTASIDLLKFALKGDRGHPNDPSQHFALSVANIARVIREAPRDMETEDGKQVDNDDESYTIDCLSHAMLYIEDKAKALNEKGGVEEELKEFESEQRAYNLAYNYFMYDFKKLPDKTREGIAESFYAFANPFMSGLLADYFAQELTDNVRPEETFKGKIIILDFPVKKYLQAGMNAQCLYKMLWQQAVERRGEQEPEDELTPVFQWIDESQYFLNEQDMMFQTTARSSRACTVYITQNINNYYAVMSGSRYKERVDSLLGNLNTKIFHANNDSVTNEWAAKTISRTFQTKINTNIGLGEKGEQGTSTSISEILTYQIEPHAFTILKNGGTKNDSQVSGVITIAGREWSNGKNYAHIYFDQNIDKTNHHE